jgi:hypothetical protein
VAKDFQGIVFMNTRIYRGVIAAVLLSVSGIFAQLAVAADVSSPVLLTGLVEFSTDASGNFDNHSVWNTRGGDTAVNLWVVSGSDLNGPFINGPADAQARVSIPLTLGENTFTLLSSTGFIEPYNALNLFFSSNDVNPGISVFGPTQTSNDSPSFAANGSPSTLTLAFQPVAGANSLVFRQGDFQVELTDYRWAQPAVNNTDRVAQRTTTPDGMSDFVGHFTLNVTRLTSPPTCAPAASGLVAWWPLEGNAEDVAGSNDGTLLGAPAFAAGKVGQAMQFDYVNDAVRIPANPTLNVGAGAGFTLEAWIKPNDLSVQHPMVEWNNDQGGIGTHFWTTVRDFDGQIKSLYANIIDANGGAHVIFTPPNLLTTAQFYHVALTYDKVSGNAALYINGNSVTQRNLGTFTPQTSSHLYLGYRSSGAATGNRFSGLMDEVSLYNRALSPSEIAAVFGADSAGKCRSEANTPPVARILLQPQVTFSPEQPHPFVIAANGSDAVIRLDASGSTDADNDPLTYAWRMAGASNPFSVQPLTVNTVPIGTHTVELVVSDGQASGTASITFEVISASEAVAEISRLLTQAGLSKRIEHPLQASLSAAMKSLEQQHLTPAVGQLKAFQKKVRASVLQLNPALAQTLTAAANMVIDALAP